MTRLVKTIFVVIATAVASAQPRPPSREQPPEAAGVSAILVSLSWAQGGPSQENRNSKPMQTVEETKIVAPALEKYAQGPLAELWKRPGLSPRDRSLVTLAALIARNQTIEMAQYMNLALDNGLKPREISEIITHLAFYSGWANAMSAVGVAKNIFAMR